MDGNQENFEFTDPETGEVHTLKADSLVSNVRDIVLSRIKIAMTIEVWNKLSQSDQQDHITAAQELGRELVGSIVMRVAEKGLTCAHVEINKFAVDVDKGEVTITSKGFASDEMLTDLAHSKGKTAKITVVDAEQFNRKSTMVKPDADQPSLLPDDEDDTPGDDAPDTSVQLDDSDSLHDAPDENLPSSEWRGGHQSRMAGCAQMRNPFTEGNGTAQQFEDWDSGWLVANDDDSAPDIDPELGADPAPEPETSTDTAETAPDDALSKAERGEDDQANYIAGVDAARDGSGTDDNPFDGGTDDYLAWDSGMTSGLKQIAELRKSGYDARNDGMAPTRCTWKKGTPEHGFWMQGYERAKKDEQD